MIWVATVILGVTFVVHTFVGGRVVAGRLLADTGLPKAAKWLSYYCWHIATVLLLFVWMAVAAAALHLLPGDARLLLAFIAALTAALSLLSAAVAMKGGIHPLRFPSTSLFALASSSLCLSLA